MFWDKGYTPSQNIEALLEKNATVEEFLDEDDILQECKSLKKSIVNYFTRPDVIKRLVELITTEPPETLPMAQRFRHSNMACEILTLGLPSLDEKLLSDVDTLKTLYSYLEKEPPLNPLLSSFFSKTFNMLFKKKAEQDWFLYQQMCLQLLEYIKSQKNFLDLICNHFSTPIIPDLIMQMMKDVEGGQLKRNLYEWLTEDKLVERLIAILGNPQETDKHANVADFFCDLIQQGRSMRQNDQEDDSFEPAFDGSNPILKTIESIDTIEALLNVILEPNAQESAIVSGISVVLTLIKPVVLADEPNSDRLKYIHEREKEIHEKILTTVIHAIVPHLKDLNELLRNPPKKADIVTTAATLSPPFGITRLRICCLFTVLLQTKNEEVSKAICQTDYFNTLFEYFKQYCWNNLLHSEVEKTIQIIFCTEKTTVADTTQNMDMILNELCSITQEEVFDIANSLYYTNDGPNGKGNKNASPSNDTTNYTTNSTSNTNTNNDNDNIKKSNANENESETKTETATETETEIPTSSTDADNAAAADNKDDDEGSSNVICSSTTSSTESLKEDGDGTESESNKSEATQQEAGENEQHQQQSAQLQNADDIANNMNSNDNDSDEENENVGSGIGCDNDKIQASTIAAAGNVANNAPAKDNNINTQDGESKHSEVTKLNADVGPSALQKHVIVNCQLISKLMDCWMNNKDSENAKRKRRLGYMGHLIKILKHISTCISESEHIGALIESNFSDASELELWQSIINPNDGDFTKALSVQNKMLANVNAHEACDFKQPTKDFSGDDSAWGLTPNCIFTDSNTNDIASAIVNDMYRNNAIDFNDYNLDTELHLLQFGRNLDDDDDDDDDNYDNWDSFCNKLTKSAGLPLVSRSSHRRSTNNICPSYDDSLNEMIFDTPLETVDFADFDSHFNNFANDMGDAMNSFTGMSAVTSSLPKSMSNFGNDSGHMDTHKKEEYDNNANVEKLTTITTPSISGLTGTGTGLTPITTLSATGDDNFDFDQKIDTDARPTTINAENDVSLDYVRNLQSRIHDLSFDFDDDEGMWTKPFGKAAPMSIDDAAIDGNGTNLLNDNDKKDGVISPPIVGNGPTNVHADECENNQKTEVKTSLSSNDDVNFARLVKDNADNAGDGDDIKVCATTTATTTLTGTGATTDTIEIQPTPTS